MLEILESIQEFTPIWNINIPKRQVRGVFALEAVRKTDGRVMDFEESVQHFLNWFNEINNATNGLSWGNVREQHTEKNVGKVPEQPFVDYANKQIIGIAEISDDTCWNKIVNGEYCAFSWGGVSLKPSDKAIAKWKAMSDGSRRYVGRPLELTITDNPNQEGTYFRIVSNSAKYTITTENGATEEREFKLKVEESEMMTKEEILEAINNAATTAVSTSTEKLTTIVQGVVTNSITSLKEQLVTDIVAQVKKDVPTLSEDKVKEIVNNAITANNSTIENTVKNVLEKTPAPNGTKTTGDTSNDKVDISAIENSAHVKLTDGEKAALEAIHAMHATPKKQ